MPYVLMWNRPAIEQKMHRLAAYLGLEAPGFDAVLKWVLQLRHRIGIPNTLADIADQFHSTLDAANTINAGKNSSRIESSNMSPVR